MPVHPKAKKLYYDLRINIAAASGTGGIIRGITLTNVNSTIPGTGDRYGNVLDSLQPLTGSSPPHLRQRGGIQAWFQVTRLGDWTVDDGVIVPEIAYVGPTGALIDYQTVGGTVANKLGQDPSFTRHPAIQLLIRRSTSAGSFTVFGTLHVQRQHSIEV